MTLVQLAKKMTASTVLLSFCGTYARAEDFNYNANQATALATCQQNNNCTREQRVQIQQYQNQANTQESQQQQATLCNGAACSKSQMEAMAAQQTQQLSGENQAAYQNGVGAANGGTLGTPTYQSNSAANGSGTSSSSGSKAMIVMVASAGAAVATATVLKTPCMNAFSSAWACPLMAVALVQVGASLLSSKGAGKSQTDLAGGAYGNSGYGATATPSPSQLGLGGGSGSNDGSSGNGSSNLSMLDAETGRLTQEAAKLNNDLKKTGYVASADGSTVTGPNGKKISTNAFSSPSAMSAAGFSDSQISAMESAMDSANNAANAAFKKVAGNLTTDAGGGGGSGSGAGGENGGTSDGYGGGYGFDPNKLAGKNSKLKGNGLAGMSKKLGDDNIGVAGDNIFEMITRRYQVRDKANNFIVEQK